MGAVPGVAAGYMTPPITPDGACFGIDGAPRDPYQVPPRCPVTPTPQQQCQDSAYAPQPHVGQYATYFDAQVGAH